jgi:hypothetical protein
VHLPLLEVCHDIMSHKIYKNHVAKLWFSWKLHESCNQTMGKLRECWKDHIAKLLDGCKEYTTNLYPNYWWFKKSYKRFVATNCKTKESLLLPPPILGMWNRNQVTKNGGISYRIMGMVMSNWDKHIIKKIMIYLNIPSFESRLTTCVSMCNMS